ncbi:class I SAM-dependent methyltransferase [Propionibacteriaceae bacterium Y1700]|uniref:class I SAM-dependent methyltransferase n=1 Tax=Microlunatus sp. Y1700 TaxID=3418487 RepID=UPI003DA70A5E
MTDEKQANEFDHPLAAAMYDQVEGSREDLDHYVAIIDELGARTVIDVGCGTGVLAIRLASSGHSVIGVDPAGHMIAVARAKAGADRVQWVHGTAEDVPDTLGQRKADVAVMTGNVAQVFLIDDAWLSTLRAIREALHPDGHLVFETRIPERRAWEEWAEWGTSVHHVEGVGEVHDRFTLVRVTEPYVTFRSDNTLPDGTVVPSESTLIFRSMPDLERTLAEAGFTISEVRDAADRPGREWVVIARVRA